MRKKIDIRHLAAALLAALMLLACLPVTQADAAGNTIRISSEAELRDLAASCTLDTWSRDKNVVLDSDLTLADPSFLPIPTFGGSFDGQGHTIHNVSITDSLSPAGLFGVVQAAAPSAASMWWVPSPPPVTAEAWAASPARTTAPSKSAASPARCPVRYT